MEKDRNDKNIGKKLDGRYEITELIGEGGMADVYRATDVVDNKTVAVKILKKEFAENEEFLRRFRNESKAIAVLSHPNIVKIYDVGFSERIQFIVMEYIDGITLNEYMEQQGQLGWKDAVHFILQILRALQHAHSKGIVHRDIKPQNIMMLRDGTIKVMDFGIAKFAREDGKTGTDKAIGTVHYISPEQARGGVTDAKSDIYSVGVMLYEMLTGKKPFDTDNPVSIAVMHMQAKVPLPSTIRPDIQIGLEEIILKAMEKDPADRYQSARDMMDDLQTFNEDPDGVFGYYPELFEEEPVQDMFEEDDSLTKNYRPLTEERGLPPEDDYYDDDQQPYYDDDEGQYYDDGYDDRYDDRGAYRDEPEEEDEEEYEEETKSFFIPILSAVIIVVMIVAAVLFTMLLWNMIQGNKSDNTNIEFKMPSLIGMDYKEAEIQYGDKIRINIESKEYSEYEKDKIFKQDIPVNDPVGKGDTVNVRVSLGAKKVLLQDFTNWDYETAKSTIVGQGLFVDKRSAYDPNVEKGRVISTDPQGPIELEPGSYVRVTLSLGKNKETVPVPNFIGMKWDLAKTTAESMKLTLAKKEVDDMAEEGTVLNQNVQPNEEVSEGSLIELTVSSGKKKEQPVRISFQIPPNAAGKFHICLYEGGIARAVGGQFDVDYAAGVTSLVLEGNETIDVVAVLVNDDNGNDATIGTYRVDFDKKSYETLSSDVNAAFEKVGGLKGPAPATTTTLAPATVTDPPATVTDPPAVTDTPAVTPADPNATPVT